MCFSEAAPQPDAVSSRLGTRVQQVWAKGETPSTTLGFHGRAHRDAATTVLTDIVTGGGGGGPWL